MPRTLPNHSARARAKLALHYDTEARQRTDMANMAKSGDFPNAEENLRNLADRSRTYASRARKRRKKGPIEGS